MEMFGNACYERIGKIFGMILKKIRADFLFLHRETNKPDSITDKVGIEKFLVLESCFKLNCIKLKTLHIKSSNLVSN
jgi:hypothetical protein